jgi:hypothetical protein
MDRKPMLIRIPLDIKQWIQAEAKDNCSSQNSFIVQSLRGAMRHAPAQSDAASSSCGQSIGDQVE